MTARLTAFLALAAFALIGLNVARYVRSPAASDVTPASASSPAALEAGAGNGEFSR